MSEISSMDKVALRTPVDQAFLQARINLVGSINRNKEVEPHTKIINMHRIQV